jgi:subtilase family serine protease
VGKPRNKWSGMDIGIELRPSVGQAALCSVMLLFVMTTAASAQFLPTRHVRREVVSGEAPFVSLLPATQTLRLDIALPLRNQPELDNLLQALYDPQSPLFQQFLSVAEFTQRFGPTEADYAAVVRFAEQNGLTVTGTSSNRVILNVEGSVENIEKAFQVSMASYQHPTEPRTFYSPDGEPSPAGLTVPLWHISGLDNFSIPHPASVRRKFEASGKATGSGPDGNFLGSDMRAAYYGGTIFDGTGQSVGLAEFGGYNITDVQTYFANVGQSLRVPVRGISTDGSALTCTGSCTDLEQALDIEEAISMAPGLDEVRVYVARASDVDVFNRMATDNISKSLSCSWGWSPPDPNSDDPIFEEFAAQGQTIFVASGDEGSYGTGALGTMNIYPSFDWYVESVGGTVLTTDGAGGPWESETAWSESGGGVAPAGFGIPKYQEAAGIITRANGGSFLYRNCPDVAIEANTDNYICYDGGCAEGWGGTSFAAPRWAAYLALMNQSRVANGKVNLGFLNIKLYEIGLEPRYTSLFHDITSGSNGAYPAVRGYDLVTGWGSPNSAGMFDGQK